MRAKKIKRTKVGFWYAKYTSARVGCKEKHGADKECVERQSLGCKTVTGRERRASGEGIFLDDFDIAVEVEEKVPFDNVCKAIYRLLVRHQQLLKCITHTNAQGLVRDLEIVLVGHLHTQRCESMPKLSGARRQECRTQLEVPISILRFSARFRIQIVWHSVAILASQRERCVALLVDSKRSFTTLCLCPKKKRSRWWCWCFCTPSQPPCIAVIANKPVLLLCCSYFFSTGVRE